MIWRRLTYSICLSILLTSISYMFYAHGGEFILWPGLLVQVILNVILLAIPTGDDFYSLPSASYLVFSFIFYTIASFVAIFLIVCVREGRKPS